MKTSILRIDTVIQLHTSSCNQMGSPLAICLYITPKKMTFTQPSSNTYWRINHLKTVDPDPMCDISCNGRCLICFLYCFASIHCCCSFLKCTVGSLGLTADRRTLCMLNTNRLQVRSKPVVDTPKIKPLTMKRKK